MRRIEDELIEPEVTASLAAIDATLAGEPVDPMHAELAELALMLAAERPQLDPAAAQRIDERIHRPAPARGPAPAATSRKRPRWIWLPAVGGIAAGLAATVAVVLVLAGSAGSPGGSSAGLSASSTTASAPASATPVPAAAAVAPGSAAATSSAASSPPTTASTGSSPAASAPASGAGSEVRLPANGRRSTQSAQLTLSTTPDRVDDVSQEVLNVAAAQSAIVRSSSVTATGSPTGYAEFQLSVPSANLAQTMAQLSQLQYANVVSRTDTSQDVNDRYLSVQHQLTDAQAQRASLLKQLAAAVTQAQIDSLNTQIHDAEATIGATSAQLRSLQAQINFSPVSVEINAGAVAPAHGGSGFTIGKAAHDAGHLLTIVAGGALIALAAALPVALVVALAWWIWATLRRRRREHALDTA